MLTDRLESETIMEEDITKSNNTTKDSNIVDDDFQADAKTLKEHENENEDEETDPFIKTWNDNRLRALTGDFRFQNQADEENFQDSLITEEKKNAVFILFTSITVGAIIYGVVDLSLLSMNSVDLGFMNINVIYFRYYFLVPIMIFGCLSIYFSIGKCNTVMKKYIQKVPLVIGSFYAIFVLAKTHLVYENLSYIQTNNIEKNMFYYSEVFEIGMLFISVIWIIPFYASIQICFWTLYLTALFFTYSQNIKLYAIFLYIWIFIAIITPMSICLVMTGFRDYYYRKQFLSRKYLEKSIKELTEEKENMDILLKSTISQELYDSITTKQHSSLRSIENAFLIRIEYKLKMNRQQLQSEDSLFEYFSELVKRTQKECELSGFKMLRATTDTFILIQSDVDRVAITEKNTAKAERIIQASFHLQRICQAVIGELIGCQVDTTVCIDQSPVAYGMIGSTKFAFDCFGSAVENTSFMSRIGKRGRLLATEAVAKNLRESRVMEAIYVSHIQNHMEETVKVYEIREVTDVMGMFISHIDWMDDAELIEAEIEEVIEI